MNCEYEDKIFSTDEAHFEELAVDLFHFQYEHNPVYNQYVNSLPIVGRTIRSLAQIPFLPIQCFKTHTIKTTAFEPQAVFESSGTTQTINSRHYVKHLDLYKQSFLTAFGQFYGPVQDCCVIGLLPSYLERRHSSLVVMVDELIRQSGHAASGFYLYEHEKLHSLLQELEAKGQKTILIGVTFALLDFAEKFPLPLKHTIVMETGGMKGRREEITRQQVHDILKAAFGLPAIHAEYGMTELLSQAYSTGAGILHCPPWMKALVREEDDPFAIRQAGSGILNVIDLANIYSCSFIATEDVARVYDDGSFEVQGRMDNSDIRGCSLMVAGL
jgi:hypothetical protein